MTRRQALIALHELNRRQIADELLAWRNKTGTTSGWDQWLRTKYPRVAAEIWKETKS